MADEGIYREVDQELEEEKQLRQLKESAPFLIGLAVVVVAVVAGWQYWGNRTSSETRVNAEAFAQATSIEDTAVALSDFTQLRQDAPDGYAALASFRIAGLEAQNGNIDGAIAALNNVVNNDGVPERLRDLASVKAAYMALDQGPDAALRQLNGLQEENSVIAAYAKEVAGLASIESGNYSAALGYFEAIPEIQNVPDPLIQRASGFKALASLGASGTTLETQSMGQSLENLLDLPAPTDQALEQADTDATAGDMEQGGTPADAPAEEGSDPVQPEETAPVQIDSEQDGTSSD